MTSPITLNQILAVRQGVQADTRREVTELHRQVAKAPLLSGIVRTYQQINDEDPDLPGESTKVQISAAAVVVEAAAKLTRLFDVTAAMDWTNQAARADVAIDGQVLLAGVPATYLLFLEKQLVDLETFMRKLPVLDPAESWHRIGTTWATDPIRTTRTAKVPRNHVLAPATDKHPAQVQMYTEDVVVGYWETIRLSGAMQPETVEKLTERVAALARAVKFARERANMTEVVDPKPATALFAYLLEDLR